MSVDAAPEPLPTWALVTGAGVLLATGAAWWVAAEPPSPPSPVAAEPVPPAVVADRPIEERVPEGHAFFPATPGVVLETHDTLGDGGMIRWQGANDGVTYRLRFACLGDGGMVVIGFEFPDATEADAYPCRSELSEMEFAGVDGGDVTVAREGGQAIVAVQIAAGG